MMSKLAPGKSSWLTASRTLNPGADRVDDVLFQAQPFFDPYDLLQVKYEMLRRVQIDGWSVSRAAAAFGVSRQTFYQAQQSFAQHGLSGLLPDKRGPRTGHKLTDSVIERLQRWQQSDPTLSAEALSKRLRQRCRVSVHPRSIERALQRQAQKKRALALSR